MMKVHLPIGILLFFFSSISHSLVLNDWIFNIDGTVSENFNGDAIPTTGDFVDDVGGTFSLDVTGAGVHNVIGFFDFEIDQAINTYFNEYGNASGVPAGLPAPVQSWEIDEPGFIFGDIVDNVLAGALDNTNSIPADAEDDVSIAFGWNFMLQPGAVATIDYMFSAVLPTAGFFLTQVDPDSEVEFYFSSALTIVNPVEVSEPQILALFALGMIMLGHRRVRRTHQ